MSHNILNRVGTWFAFNVVTAFLLHGTVVAAATTDNWTDGTGFWSTAANWTTISSTHVVPAAGDQVNIPLAAPAADS